MAATANGVPYPVSTDAPNVPADLLALANFLNPAFGWQAYTPTVSGTGWSGGTVTGEWCQVGKTVHFRITYTLGASGYGTGALTFSLPTNSNGVYQQGLAGFLDTSGSVRYGGVAQILTSTCIPMVGPAAAGGADRSVTSTVPVASGTGDVITVNGTYRAA